MTLINDIKVTSLSEKLTLLEALSKIKTSSKNDYITVEFDKGVYEKQKVIINYNPEQFKINNSNLILGKPLDFCLKILNYGMFIGFLSISCNVILKNRYSSEIYFTPKTQFLLFTTAAVGSWVMKVLQHPTCKGHLAIDDSKLFQKSDLKPSGPFIRLR